MRLTGIFLILLLFLISGGLSGCILHQGVTDEGFGIDGKWILPESDQDMPVWGIRNGIVLGIYPARLSWGDAVGGPRGLFRIGYETGENLVFANFMAIHPIETTGGGLKGNGSELETSPKDGKPGIRFFAYPVDYLKNSGAYSSPPDSNLAAEVIQRDGRQVLTWGVKTERFPNGVECFFIFEIDEKRPFEFRVRSYVLRNQNRVKSLVLTATFGNITRLRTLYLASGTTNAETLYPGDYGGGFGPFKLWRPAQLPRANDGSLLFVCEPDEATPWKTPPYPHNNKLLQYFRKDTGSWDSGIKGLVNARTRYWKSTKRIPSGNAFENMALVENFDQGQSLYFGLYKGSVSDLKKGRIYDFQ